MKTFKINSLKFIVTGIAIAMGITSLKPVNAQNTEVPEIGWSSRLSSMGLDKPDDIGKRYTFYCQAASENLIYSPIWGTNIYTVNSDICTTAVHSGMIVAQQGGEVTIELLKGQKFYTGSHKNNITSQDYRESNISFSFVGEKITQTEKSTSSDQQPVKKSSGIERVMVNGVQKGVERSIEKVITNLFK